MAYSVKPFSGLGVCVIGDFGIISLELQEAWIGMDSRLHSER